MGKVIISPNIVKTVERIDFNGNVIDPKTKTIITPRESDSIAPPMPITPPKPVIAPVASPLPIVDGLSVLQQIEATKKQLQELEELKRLEIAKKKAELELLEQ